MKITDEMVEAGVASLHREDLTLPSKEFVAKILGAALSASPAGVVKPLEWEPIVSPREDGPHEATGDVEADTMIGEYSVYFDEDEAVADTPWCCWSPVECVGHFADFEAAKSAAFADYSARIMIAIEPAGVGVETAPPSTHVASVVRHAFMSGAGYGDFDRISDADQRRWAAYSPPCLEGNADAVASGLAAALEPFADQAEFWSEDVADKTPLLEKDNLTVGDVRTAAKALRVYRAALKGDEQ